MRIPDKDKNGIRRYGKWGWNEVGVKEDPRCCVIEIQPHHTSVPRQCSSVRGHGPNGEFCKQHAKIMERS